MILLVIDFISSKVAAALLGVSTHKLFQCETPDGKWVMIYGHRIRVYRPTMDPRTHRRYDRNEIVRVLRQLRYRP